MRALASLLLYNLQNMPNLRGFITVLGRTVTNDIFTSDVRSTRVSACLSPPVVTVVLSLESPGEGSWKAWNKSLEWVLLSQLDITVVLLEL